LLGVTDIPADGNKMGRNIVMLFAKTETCGIVFVFYGVRDLPKVAGAMVYHLVDILF
jgi:hypothetical protein